MIISPTGCSEGYTVQVPFGMYQDEMPKTVRVWGTINEIHSVWTVHLLRTNAWRPERRRPTAKIHALEAIASQLQTRPLSAKIKPTTSLRQLAQRLGHRKKA